jgi:hypothetical protein
VVTFRYLAAAYLGPNILCVPLPSKSVSGIPGAEYRWAFSGLSGETGLEYPGDFYRGTIIRLSVVKLIEGRSVGSLQSRFLRSFGLANV